MITKDSRLFLDMKIWGVIILSFFPLFLDSFIQYHHHLESPYYYLKDNYILYVKTIDLKILSPFPQQKNKILALPNQAKSNRTPQRSKFPKANLSPSRISPNNPPR